YPWGSLGELKRMQRNARGTSASFVSDQIVQDGPRCREVPPYHSVSRLFHGVDHQLAARIFDRIQNVVQAREVHARPLDQPLIVRAVRDNVTQADPDG